MQLLLVLQAKSSMQSKVTDVLEWVGIQFKNGYEFQLQRKLYRKRSVAVEMRFISCI